MEERKMGTLLADKMPNGSGLEQCLKPNYYTSAKQANRKSPNKSFFGNWGRTEIENQLGRYLDLGLIPVPLKGKRPLVKWKQWHPNKIEQLKPYLRPGVNWGLKTGANLSIIDFDTRQAFTEFQGKHPEI